MVIMPCIVQQSNSYNPNTVHTPSNPAKAPWQRCPLCWSGGLGSSWGPSACGPCSYAAGRTPSGGGEGSWFGGSAGKASAQELAGTVYIASNEMSHTPTLDPAFIIQCSPQKKTLQFMITHVNTEFCFLQCASVNVLLKFLMWCSTTLKYLGRTPLNIGQKKKKTCSDPFNTIHTQNE